MWLADLPRYVVLPVGVMFVVGTPVTVCGGSSTPAGVPIRQVAATRAAASAQTGQSPTAGAGTTTRRMPPAQGSPVALASSMMPGQRFRLTDARGQIASTCVMP